MSTDRRPPTDCQRAMRALVDDGASSDALATADAHAAADAHITACAACQVRLEAFAAAIGSGREELSPAEARARLPRYVELELAGQDAAAAFPLVHALLARSPDLAAEHQLLRQALTALEAGTLPEPEVQPTFDLSFLEPPPAAAPSPEPAAHRSPAWPARLRRALGTLAATIGAPVEAPDEAERRAAWSSAGLLVPVLVLLVLVLVATRAGLLGTDTTAPPTPELPAAPAVPSMVPPDLLTPTADADAPLTAPVTATADLGQQAPPAATGDLLRRAEPSATPATDDSAASLQPAAEQGNDGDASDDEADDARPAPAVTPPTAAPTDEPYPRPTAMPTAAPYPEPPTAMPTEVPSYP